MLVLSFGVLSQTPEKKVIRWFDPSLPKECCRNYYDNNHLVTSYSDDSIEYVITLLPEIEKNYIVANVAVLNKSDKTIDVNPSAFSIRTTEPVSKTYPALNAQEVAEKIEKRGRWRGFLASYLSGGATKESTAVVTDNSGNIANVTITERDNEAIRERRKAIEAQRQKKVQKGNMVRSFSLPLQTLFKGDSIIGLVFFKKEGALSGLILSFTTGNTVYEVPYGTERTKLNKP
jgi:hypothetical protein